VTALATAPKSFRYEERGGAARITLTRPAKKNALTFEVYRELTDTFHALRKSDVRAVSITGEGSGFCSGGDVEDIIGPLLAMSVPELLAFTRMTCELIAAMRACPQPILALVNGVAAGAGAAIVLACDLRLAARTAKFAFLFTKVGLAGADMGAAFLLPRVIGRGRATELLMLGDAIDAETAERYGLVNRVLEAEALPKEGEAWLARLVAGPRMGLAMTKDALDRELSVDLAAALEAEAQAQALCMGHPDFKEGFKAFVEKRPLRFLGAP
jgi:enoyl-CoA hydratase/carnithine racemase